MSSKLSLRVVDDAPKPAARIRMVRPHGFIDEYGQNRFWPQGMVIGDPAQVSLLIERGADVEFLE